MVRGFVGPVCVWLRWELLLYDLKGNIVTGGRDGNFSPSDISARCSFQCQV